MADYRALTLQGGTYAQIQNANSVIVGAGITTAAGNLTITAAGTDVIVAAGKNLSMGAGAGAADFSGGSGIFRTTTGAVTIGPGAITVSGSMTMQAGTTLSTTGTGNINLPNNASARFQIETVAVSANVTSANLNTLTAGPASDASALHTHPGIPTALSFTSGAAISTGALVALQNVAGAPRLFHADANGAAPLNTAYLVATSSAGAAGISVTVAANGDQVDVPDAVWDAVPAVTDVGSPVYLSETAGNWTLTAPSTSGSTVQSVGYVSRGGAGAVRVLIVVGAPVTLA